MSDSVRSEVGEEAVERLARWLFERVMRDRTRQVLGAGEEDNVDYEAGWDNLVPPIRDGWIKWANDAIETSGLVSRERVEEEQARARQETVRDVVEALEQFERFDGTTHHHYLDPAGFIADRFASGNEGDQSSVDATPGGADERQEQFLREHDQRMGEVDEALRESSPDDPTHSMEAKVRVLEEERKGPVEALEEAQRIGAEPRDSMTWNRRECEERGQRMMNVISAALSSIGEDR